MIAGVVVWIDGSVARLGRLVCGAESEGESAFLLLLELSWLPLIVSCRDSSSQVEKRLMSRKEVDALLMIANSEV